MACAAAWVSSLRLRLRGPARSSCFVERPFTIEPGKDRSHHVTSINRLLQAASSQQQVGTTPGPRLQRTAGIVTFAEDHRHPDHQSRDRGRKQNFFSPGFRAEARVSRVDTGTHDTEIDDALDTAVRGGFGNNPRRTLMRIMIAAVRGLFDDPDQVHESPAAAQRRSHCIRIEIIKLDHLRGGIQIQRGDLIGCARRSHNCAGDFAARTQFDSAGADQDFRSRR